MFLGETVRFTAEELGTGVVTDVDGSLEITLYRTPDAHYRLLIKAPDLQLQWLEPSNFIEALGKEEPAEYWTMTLEEGLAGTYAELFETFAKKTIPRDID